MAIQSKRRGTKKRRQPAAKAAPPPPVHVIIHRVPPGPSPFGSHLCRGSWTPGGRATPESPKIISYIFTGSAEQWPTVYDASDPDLPGRVDQIHRQSREEKGALKPEELAKQRRDLQIFKRVENRAAKIGRGIRRIERLSLKAEGTRTKEERQELDLFRKSGHWPGCFTPGSDDGVLSKVIGEIYFALGVHGVRTGAGAWVGEENVGRDGPLTLRDRYRAAHGPGVSAEERRSKIDKILIQILERCPNVRAMRDKDEALMTRALACLRLRAELGGGKAPGVRGSRAAKVTPESLSVALAAAALNQDESWIRRRVRFGRYDPELRKWIKDGSSVCTGDWRKNPPC